MSGGDTWKGATKVSSELGKRVRSAQILIRFFALYWLVFFAGFFVIFSNARDTHNTGAWVYAKYLSATDTRLKKTLKIRLNNDQNIVRSYDDVLVHPGVTASRDSFVTVFLYGLLFSTLLSLFLVKKTRKYFVGYGGQKDNNKKLIRGGIKVETNELIQILADRGLVSPYKMGGLPLKKNAETQHIFISGATGSGKGNAIKSLLDDIVIEKKRFFVYDKSGEYVTKYYRNGYDIILNPFDARMPCWSPWKEAESVFDFEHLATSFIPDSEKEKEHWIDAPRTVFSDLLAVLKEHEKTDVNYLFEQFQDKNKLFKLLEGTSSANIIDPEGVEHAASVLGVLAPKIKSLRYLSGLSGDEFSLRQWVRNEDDDRRVFITANERQLKSTKALIGAWLDIIISEMISLPEDRARRMFGIVDELASLDAINSIKTGINEGRKFGLSLILSVTSIEMLRSIYGQRQASAMLAMCNTKVSFRCDESDVAKWLADLYYEEDIVEAKDSATLSDNHDSLNLRDERQKRHLILPTEFMQLEDNTAYVKLGGSLPITEIQVPYKDRPTVAERMLDRDVKLYSGHCKETDDKPDIETGVSSPMEATKPLINPDDFSTEELNTAPKESAKAKTISKVKPIL